MTLVCHSHPHPVQIGDRIEDGLLICDGHQVLMSPEPGLPEASFDVLWEDDEKEWYFHLSYTSPEWLKVPEGVAVVPIWKTQKQLDDERTEAEDCDCYRDTKSVRCY